jgi:DNA-binding protein HU-beta
VHQHFKPGAAGRPRVRQIPEREEVSNKMTKEQIVARIAKEASISKKAAAASLNTFVGAVTAELKKGRRVPLVGFGTFMVRRVKARMGRNPQTGKEIKIPAGKRAVFKAGKALKDAVRK